MGESIIFIIRMDMSLWPSALWMIRDLISLMVSSPFKSRNGRLGLVLYDWISRIAKEEAKEVI